MLTTHAKEIGENLWEATWVVQGRGFSVKSESGVILRAMVGITTEYVHAKDEGGARALLKKRMARAEKMSRADQLREMSSADLKSRFGDVECKISDSLAAGNCQTGTANWANNHFPGRSTATVAEVLSAQANSYTLRAVRAAIIRQKSL